MGRPGTNHGGASGRSQFGKRLVRRQYGFRTVTAPNGQSFTVPRVELSCGHFEDAEGDKRKVYCTSCARERNKRGER